MAHNICSICGSTEEREYISIEGIYVSKCPNCGYVELPKSEKANENAKLIQEYAFLLEANKLCAEIFNNINTPENIRWPDKMLKGDVKSYLNTPLYGMLYAAWLTKGFTVKKTSRANVVLETVYKHASDLKEQSVVLEVLVKLYDESVKQEKEKKERERSKKDRKSAMRRSLIKQMLVGIASLPIIALLVCLINIATFAPTIVDGDSGVSVHVFNDSVSMLHKIDLSLSVERHTPGSRHYIEAMDTLKYMTDNISVYDINMSSRDRDAKLKKAVSFTFPIPEGFDASCLKVYYLFEDNTYKEVASKISVSTNTISFTEDKLGLYVVAENHPKIVTVTYDVNSGNKSGAFTMANESQDVAYKTSDTIINTMKSDGYNFIGWATDKSGSVMVTDKSGRMLTNVKDYTDSDGKWICTNDVTLYAQWSARTFKVTYDANGGKCSRIEDTVTYDSVYSLPTPTRADHAFIGWYLDETEILNQNQVTTTGDHTLKARWVKVTSTYNSGIRTITIAEGKKVEEFIKLSLDADTLISEGYTKVTINVTFDAKVIHSCYQRIIVYSSDTGKEFYAKDWDISEDDWQEGNNFAFTVNISELQSGCSFYIRWECPDSYWRDEWELGTVTVNVMAIK